MFNPAKKGISKRLISRKCEVGLAPHLPDWKPLEFHLRGYLKDNKHQNNPQAIGELKAAITAKINEIPKNNNVCIIDNFTRSMQIFQDHSKDNSEDVFIRKLLCAETFMTEIFGE